jgi:hypothetical protein
MGIYEGSKIPFLYQKGDATMKREEGEKGVMGRRRESKLLKNQTRKGKSHEKEV